MQVTGCELRKFYSRRQKTVRRKKKGKSGMLFTTQLLHNIKHEKCIDNSVYSKNDYVKTSP